MRCQRLGVWLSMGLLCGMVALLPAQARPQISTIALQQRPAAELAPVLQPLLAAHESVTGDGYTLILNVEPARLEQLSAVIAELDRAPRRLRITVRQQQFADNRIGSGGVAAGIDSEHTRVIASPPDAGSGAEVRYRGVGVYGADPTGAQRDSAEQTVQALEGRPAHIAVGLIAPFDSVCEDDYGRRRACTEYREVSTGFDVLARLDAGGVTLDVSPQAQQLAGGDLVAFQLAQTQLRGPLGQWLELAGEATTSGESRDHVLASTAHNSRSARRIVIKVELVP